jgi:putative membrane protein (TIGR04086 family)
MKLRSLAKYTLFMFILTLAIFLILTIYIYFFSKTSSLEVAYNFVAPASVFVTSLLYARSVHEKGLLRGIEMWIVYFVIALLLHYSFNSGSGLNIVQHLISLPVSIIGGILGVNVKK